MISPRNDYPSALNNLQKILGKTWMKNNPLNAEVTGTVVNLTDFGIFVEVSEGVEGLVHISEIDTEIPKEKLATVLSGKCTDQSKGHQSRLRRKTTWLEYHRSNGNSCRK